MYIRRIFNYCIHLNKQICEIVGLSEETAKCIEQELKTLIHSSICFFKDKHIDQIIICTIYIIQAMKNEKTRDKMFNHIIHCYHQAKPQDCDNIFKSIFSNVKHSSKTYDIIGFYNEIFMPIFSEKMHRSNFEDKEPKRRKVSSPDNSLNELPKKMKFDDDSAYDNSPIIYDSLKTTNITSGINTPIKGSGSYGSFTPDLSKTPRTNKVRSFALDYLVKNEKVTISLSPKKTSKTSIFGQKIIKAKESHQSQQNEPLLPQSNIFSNKMDIIKEEPENQIKPTILYNALKFENIQMDKDKEKEASQSTTPKFSKYE